MCGRYNITTDAGALMTAFDVLEGNFKADSVATSRYNISPSVALKDGEEGIAKQLTEVPIVRMNPEGEREIIDAIWPLIPVWGKGRVPKYSTANARAESMADKPAFRSAWKKRQRALLPMSGYYEWQKIEGQRTKQPFHMLGSDHGLLAAAGLWDVSFTQDDRALISTTIVTCDPSGNDLCHSIHNRMPLFIRTEDIETWLHGSAEEAMGLVRPCPVELMDAYPISTKVNNPGFDNASIIEPLT